MSWIGVAVAVGSSLVGMEQSQQVAKKQDNVLAQQIQQQMATTKKNAEATQAMIAQQKQQPQVVQQQKNTAQQQFQTALKANSANAAAPLNTVGDVSSAYQKAKQDAALGATDNVNQFSNLTASINAPGRANMANRANIADYGTGMNLNNLNQQGQNYLDQLKLSKIHANPWISLLTSAAGGAAKGAAGAGASDPWSGYGQDITDLGNITGGAGA